VAVGAGFGRSVSALPVATGVGGGMAAMEDGGVADGVDACVGTEEPAGEAGVGATAGSGTGTLATVASWLDRKIAHAAIPRTISITARMSFRDFMGASQITLSWI
jgi:hypothetical protein